MNIELHNEIKELAEQKEKLREENQRFRLLLNSTSDIIFELNEKQQHVAVYGRWLEQSGFSPEEFIGRTARQIFGEDHSAIHEINNGKALKGEFVTYDWSIKKNDEKLYFQTSLSPLTDIQGNIIGIVGVGRDITARKKTEEYLQYLSFHDQLTGLYNRGFYEMELVRLDTERNLPLSLVMIDANGLKLVNDAFGHKAGDIFLQKIARILKKQFRQDDIIARIGGDEFVILLPKTDCNETKNIIKRINHAIKNERLGSVNISVSCGWETKVDKNQDINDVYKKAENRMYRQKTAERTKVQYATIRVIMQSLYEKIPGEREHCYRVSQLCQEMGEALNLCHASIQILKTAGLLHDIGKIIINNEVLMKRKPLSVAEWMEIKRHPEVGYNILSSVNEYGLIAEYILAHHENWNGTGYPKGLRGGTIPQFARIIKVADAYDAMISNRPYRKAMDQAEAIKELRRYAGSQFDPHIVETLIKVLTLGNRPR